MALAGTVPERQVRALFSARTVTVYQAYRPEIADRALAAGTFVPPFRLGRMTWIKPSFLWMMYRSGWAAKPGQERVLAIQITREGLEWALSHSALSHYEPGTYASQQQWAEKKLASPARIQWDPERSLLLQPLPWRSIQIGLSGEAAARYVREWITSITDITPLAERINHHVSSGDLSAARAEMPAEQVYPLPASIRTRIGASPALPAQPDPPCRSDPLNHRRTGRRTSAGPGVYQIGPSSSSVQVNGEGGAR
jgi:hypothetical protein